jgi:hypothetical protein
MRFAQSAQERMHQSNPIEGHNQRSLAGLLPSLNALHARESVSALKTALRQPCDWSASPNFDRDYLMDEFVATIVNALGCLDGWNG